MHVVPGWFLVMLGFASDCSEAQASLLCWEAGGVCQDRLFIAGLPVQRRVSAPADKR